MSLGTPVGTSSGQDPSEPEKLGRGGFWSRKVGQLLVSNLKMRRQRLVSDQITDKMELAGKKGYKAKSA